MKTYTKTCKLETKGFKTFAKKRWQVINIPFSLVCKDMVKSTSKNTKIPADKDKNIQPYNFKRRS